MVEISVIVPIYQVEKFIERCLDSILKQTYQNFELICVDDCGTDHSMEIVKHYADQYPDKVRIIESEVNVGLGAARDKAIAIAEGTYLCFVDSDDYVKTDYLERLLDAALENKADLVVCGYDRTDGEKHTLYEVCHDDDKFAWTHPSAWAKLYRTEYLRQNELNFMGVRRNEDERFLFRVLEKEPVIAQVPYVGYYYWINNDSLTMRRDVDRTKYVETYLQTAEETLKVVKCSGDNRELFEYCFVSYLNAAVLYYGRGCGKKRMAELYQKYENIMKKFPDICNNRYIALRQLKSETRNNRFASWLVLRFRRFGLDRMLFMLDSHL